MLIKLSLYSGIIQLALKPQKYTAQHLNNMKREFILIPFYIMRDLVILQKEFNQQIK